MAFMIRRRNLLIGRSACVGLNQLSYPQREYSTGNTYEKNNGNGDDIKPEIKPNPKLAPLNIMVLPVTNKKIFLYYNFNQQYNVHTYLSLKTLKPVTTSTFNPNSNSTFNLVSEKFKETKLKASIYSNKFIVKFNSVWLGLLKSDKRSIKYCCNLIQKLIDNINWNEICLRSIPSREVILREIQVVSDTDKQKNIDNFHNDMNYNGNRDDGKGYLKKHDVNEMLLKELKLNHEKRVNFILDNNNNNNYNDGDNKITITHDEMINNKISLNLIKPIPLYFPKEFISNFEVSKKLEKISINSTNYHTKQLIYCLVGIPLTLPIAVVPLIPNFPGFYLCYRAYCHVKALVGLKHLKYLLNNGSIDSSNLKNGKRNSFLDENYITGNLIYEDLKEFNDIYSKYSGNRIEFNSSLNDKKEKMVINKEMIADIVQFTGLQDLKTPLEIAYKQESKKRIIIVEKKKNWIEDLIDINSNKVEINNNNNN
ncbi:Mrx19p ASCRUDRAFT_9706 [Ascoidea rubescens DSM 1968]|uniref:Uncharacterized protein n=1 Tax=Ascoidea rubescens DSM 1968 TaxID=1344418 RepID=A0A1D2VBT0_9ASCO|nr:hypothetical protein ASCRUDRAFT_9706 [Ascoidea rubescens DSM 1968]ODV58933.1 hypothetical protein ASCRUDRAFT_9706 [Ascoidea rubescens DSM 1968]